MIAPTLTATVPEPLPHDADWSPTLMFEVARVATAHYHGGLATRAWACQVLADQMHRVSDEYARERISAMDCNRHLLTLFQHLQFVRGFRAGLFQRRSIFLGTVPLVLRGLRLDGQVFRELRLRHVTFHSCNFVGTDLSRGQMRECAFIACNFDEADLTRVRFRKCDFRGCSFRRGSLSEADFRTCQLLGCNLEDAFVNAAKGLP